MKIVLLSVLLVCGCSDQGISLNEQLCREEADANSWDGPTGPSFNLNLLLCRQRKQKEDDAELMHRILFDVNWGTAHV